MSQAEALLHLQDIELAFLRAQKRLTEITALLADDQAVMAARAGVDAVHERLTPLRARARNLELEMQSNAQKAKATEEQLYSGRVKNTKEMRDMEAEVASLKKRNGELEERLLETMVAVEDDEAALAQASAALDAATAEASRGQDVLRREQAALQQEVALLRKRREAALQAVEPSALEKYNALRPRKHNQPVALLRGSTCAACGVEQTLAIEREARIGQSLVTCLSCGRILVYRPE